MYLRDFREGKGLTQRTMSEKLRVSISYYQKIEAGFCSPGSRFLMTLRSTFQDFDVNRLLDEKIKTALYL